MSDGRRSAPSRGGGLSGARRRTASSLILSLGLAVASSSANAQDLEPRAYSASPTGVNFLVVGTGRSTGGVVVDPALPVEDVEASVNALTIGAGRTFNLFGRTGLFVAAFPYAWAKATGSVGETSASVSRSGLADPRLKLSVNFLGGRALTVREFASVDRRTIVGASLSVAPPLGQYDRTRLINLGANRWAFKPEIGISHLVGRWTVEGYAGVWLFQTNDEFYAGASARTQEPIVALQLHGSYALRSRMWVAVDGTWYSGGRTSIDGVDKGDLQRNSRVGVTLSVPLPLSGQQSLKVAGSTGATTRIGADFKTIAVAWQLSWFD